ncbi:MAG: DUF1294 domain-containing protein [Ruminococcus sp.]|nr:DUF1294 domain-containing protein [Ruminococcus sp.]
MSMLTDFLREHFLLVGALILVMNIITLAAFGVDKLKAKMGTYRIPEKVLLTLSFLYGAVGGVIGMYAFHHKTRKAKFYIFVPLFAVLQIISLCVLYI